MKAALRSAFAGVLPPDEADIISPDCLLNDETLIEDLERLRAIPWERYPSLLKTERDYAAADALRVMSPEAFAYFLPGFLLVDLESKEPWSWRIGDGISDSFGPPATSANRGYKVTSFTARMDRLSNPQLDALILYFNHVQEERGDDSDLDFSPILQYLTRLRESRASEQK